MEGQKSVVSARAEDSEADLPLDEFLADFDETSGEGEMAPGREAEMAAIAAMKDKKEPEQIKILDSYFLKRTIDGKELNIALHTKIKNAAKNNIAEAIIEIKLFDEHANQIGIVQRHIEGLVAGQIRNVNTDTPKKIWPFIKDYASEVIKVFPVESSGAEGCEAIKVLRHSFHPIDGLYGPVQVERGKSVAVTIENMTEECMAAVVCACDFYDSDGELMDSVRKRISEIKANATKSFVIASQKLAKDAKKYSVSIIKVITSQEEKILIYRAGTSRMGTGEELVRGLLKNISNSAVDAWFVATFFSSENEVIGTRVLKLEGISPNSTREFSFVYMPPAEGERVSKSVFDIGTVVEPLITNIENLSGVETSAESM
jgi:hypothetical protein